MTREEIEADIAELKTMHSICAWSREPVLSRAIERLKSDLAKLDGPAPGFVRVRLAVALVRGSDGAGYAAVDERSYADAMGGDPDCVGPLAIVVADVPLPRVVEIEGTVAR